MSENKHTPEPLCPVTLPFAIMDQEMKDLMRFHECAMDGEGYGVPKERMKRLAEIGLLRRVTANFYEHTIFGLSIINGDFLQKSEVEKQRDERLNSLQSQLSGLQERANLAERERDGLLAALKRINGFSMSQFAKPNDAVIECWHIAGTAIANVKGGA